MMRRVSWSAVIAVLHTLCAIGFAVVDDQALTVAFGLSAVTWAVLSLKERA